MGTKWFFYKLLTEKKKVLLWHVTAKTPLLETIFKSVTWKSGLQFAINTPRSL